MGHFLRVGGATSLNASMSRSPAVSAEPYFAVALRAALWLIFLAPFFYLTYGFANLLASRQELVGSIVFDWERRIPFVAWTIVPYWSINLFYALSLFANDTRQGVDRLAGRYLTAQVVAVACFILFPLTATFVRPETSGLPGFMFAVLGGFDKPFNQAPSLHIALLVIIWDHLRPRFRGAMLVLWHSWCLLIGVSVLTTWQHHFIDIPTGALLGLFALWLFPRGGALPFSDFRAGGPRARRLAGYYIVGALLCLAAAVAGAYVSPLWLALLWPGLALAIVGFGYAGAGPKVFQKAAEGCVSLASRLLLLPYRVGVRLNIWLWTRGLAPRVTVVDGVCLGRFPTAAEASKFATVLDIAAELPRPAASSSSWVSVPMMDLVMPAPSARDAAVARLQEARRDGPVLVCCALGFQRSAGVVAAWLVADGHVAGEDEAYALLARAGRPVHRLEATAKPGGAHA